MPDNPPQQLDYAPPLPAAAYRRWGKFVLRWGAIVAVIVAAVLYGPSAVRQLWYLRGQRRCLEYTLPANQVVYSNIAGEVKSLLGSGYKPPPTIVVAGGMPNIGTLSTTSAGFVMPPLAGVGEETMARYMSGGTGSLRVNIPNAPMRVGGFLHVRRNAEVKEDRLVAVVFIEYKAVGPLPWRLDINALVWRPATWELGSRLELTGLTSLPLTTLDGKNVQVFAGQIDPTHDNRFILPYAIDGQRGTIEGTLNFLDRVELQVRNSPALPTKN